MQTTASIGRAQTGLMPWFLGSVLNRPSQQVRRECASEERFSAACGSGQSTGLPRKAREPCHSARRSVRRRAERSRKLAEGVRLGTNRLRPVDPGDPHATPCQSYGGRSFVPIIPGRQSSALQPVGRGASFGAAAHAAKPRVAEVARPTSEGSPKVTLLALSIRSRAGKIRGCRGRHTSRGAYLDAKAAVRNSTHRASGAVWRDSRLSAPGERLALGLSIGIAQEVKEGQFRLAERTPAQTQHPRMHRYPGCAPG